MKQILNLTKTFAVAACIIFSASVLNAQVPVIPPAQELERDFCSQDERDFVKPPKVYWPETWFHYIGGNVSLEGITADLEAIASAGISGIQLFHGHQDGAVWPGVTDPIECLSENWDRCVKYTAEECRRLGLRFTMQNCPGWAMSGGPWIKPSQAMRHLAWTRTDVDASDKVNVFLPASEYSKVDWRDYKDIMVLAFPTPLGDTGNYLEPSAVYGSGNCDWASCVAGKLKDGLGFAPSEPGSPHWVEFEFPENVDVRTLIFPEPKSMVTPWEYDPDMEISFYVIDSDGVKKELLHTNLPAATWQDTRPISWACPEVGGAGKYRIEIRNGHNIKLKYIKMLSAARKNSWESEAGWVLRAIERNGSVVSQSHEAYVSRDEIVDITEFMDSEGNLSWNAPKPGKWTVLRIGNVNTGKKNAPAPPEGTGWECDKLSVSGPETHFAGYIGRLVDGPLEGGLLNGMLMDSWECETQTWTPDMEAEFARVAGYSLREWLPAVFGYVIDDPEKTARFLLDWRRTMNDLLTDKFYGRMAELAKEKGLSITYETAAGDIFPTDPLEYYKHADVPMCEYWHPFSPAYVGSLNFKPIKPAVSAARMYGKPRVAAEAFTSFNLTWDEHFDMFKEIFNVNTAEGATHTVFHTYTHNPQVGFLPPGTSFGSGIGSPFMRGQTWWKFMPEFSGYLARCGFMLERGKPVSDVLWYLGDEMNVKPDQEYPFPAGFKYDYCNPDALIERISVKDGLLTTPEGISYKVLWIPDNVRMRPETLEKLYSLIKGGATVIGDAPRGLATLSGGSSARKVFDRFVRKIWGPDMLYGIRKVGKGTVISGRTLDESIHLLGLEPDVKGGDALWLHRKTSGADWYFVCSPKGKGFKGNLQFRSEGNAEIWDPVSGKITAIDAKSEGGYSSVALDMPQSGSCFVVFRKGGNSLVAGQSRRPVSGKIALDGPWKLSFPDGWGAPASLEAEELKPWKDLDMSAEAKAFSGTVTYTKKFNIENFRQGMQFVLDLGKVDMVAEVFLNGVQLRTLWCAPYKLDIGDALKAGENELTVKVTGTWFNRLVFDAGQPENIRKTWTIRGPGKDVPLRDSGLCGPVVIEY